MEENFNKFTELLEKASRLAEANNNTCLESSEVAELYSTFAKASAEPVSVDKSGHAIHIKYEICQNRRHDLSMETDSCKAWT